MVGSGRRRHGYRGTMTSLQKSRTLQISPGRWPCDHQLGPVFVHSTPRSAKEFVRPYGFATCFT